MSSLTRQFFLWSLVALFFLMFYGQANACTGVTVKTKDGSVISSRTLEFGVSLNSEAIFAPRNHKVDVLFKNGKKGLSWKNKYAILGINGFGMPLPIEGFNEKGLSVGGFYFAHYAKFQKLTPENSGKALTSSHFPMWVIGNFETVDQVKKALNKVVIVDESPKGMDMPLPAHYRITDAKGNVIVVEFVERGIKVYDNPTGVITNAPEFDWHLTNLDNYLNLSPMNPKPLDLHNKTFRPTGFGAGMRGLPGDFSPPSRFVRAVALSMTSDPVETAEEGVNLTWHIINNIDIPSGAARGTEEDGSISKDITEWTNVSDLTNLKLYFRTYNNPMIRVIDMKKFDFNGKKIKYIPMDTEPKFQDVTGEAK